MFVKFVNNSWIIEHILSGGQSLVWTLYIYVRCFKQQLRMHSPSKIVSSTRLRLRRSGDTKHFARQPPPPSIHSLEYSIHTYSLLLPMFIASSSSRALLLAKGARCCHRSLPRLSHETLARSLKAPHSSRLSTFTFDGNAFGSHYSFFSDIPTIDGNSFGSPTADASLVQKDILTPNNLSSTYVSSRHYQFQQQIQQWISSNPKVAPYKAEESLARLWVEQQDLFRRWQEQHVQTTSPTIIFTTESVNLVLQAWCYSSNGEIGAERAERLLHSKVLRWGKPIGITLVKQSSKHRNLNRGEDLN